MAEKKDRWLLTHASKYGFPAVCLVVVCGWASGCIAVVAWWGGGQVDWIKEKIVLPALQQHVATLKELGSAVKSNAVTQSKQAETQAQQAQTLDALNENVKAIRDTQESIDRAINRPQPVAASPPTEFDCDP